MRFIIRVRFRDGNVFKRECIVVGDGMLYDFKFFENWVKEFFKVVKIFDWG